MSDPGSLALLLRVVREGLILLLLLSAPPLLASLLVGLAMGVLQAVTTVHEQTLSFVPRLVAVVVVLLLLGPALGAHLVRFTEAIFVATGSVR